MRIYMNTKIKQNIIITDQILSETRKKQMLM